MARVKTKSVRKMTVKQMLLCTLPPISSQIAREGRDVEAVQLEWRAWNREHGLRWRLQNGMLGKQDDRLTLSNLTDEEVDELRRGPRAPEPPGFWEAA